MQRVWWKYEGWHLVFYIPGGIKYTVLEKRSEACPQPDRGTRNPVLVFLYITGFMPEFVPFGYEYLFYNTTGLLLSSFIVASVRG